MPVLLNSPEATHLGIDKDTLLSVQAGHEVEFHDSSRRLVNGVVSQTTSIRRSTWLFVTYIVENMKIDGEVPKFPSPKQANITLRVDFGEEMEAA